MEIAEKESLKQQKQEINKQFVSFESFGSGISYKNTVSFS
jgi:hypothetical protein